MADSPVTPIPLRSDTEPPAGGGETNPTLLEPDARPGTGAPAMVLPERIGHYKVVREIGAGGMGHVLKCLDTTLNRFVALKVLRPALARNAAFIERFRREAHAVAKLRHPNVVQIYAIDSDGGHDYFTMVYVDGEGLDRILARRRRLPEREAIQIGLQVCRGLEAAHAAGILHRDIKPGNVLVDNAGRAQLGDFGLAKFEFQQTLRTSAAAAEAGIRGGDPSATDPGRVMGTPFYMAPELIQGREADARTDVYAVGVMLYELLAGEVPFRDTDVDAIFDKHLNELPRSIADANPEVSLETANLVYRALEKNPADRFPTAAALGDALEHCLERERRARELQTQAKISAEMASAFGTMHRGGAMGPRVAGVVTRLILVLLLIAGIYLVMEGLETTPPVSPIAGTALEDRLFEPGHTVRYAGIVNAVTGDADQYRIALYSPAGERWVCIPTDEWNRSVGPDRPAEESWWAVEGLVVAEGEAPPEVRPVPAGIWAVDPLVFLRIVEDSNTLKGMRYDQAVVDPDQDMLGQRVAVQGTIVWREDRGTEGDVRLLLVRGGQDQLALSVVITAEARRQGASVLRCRIGERIHAVGRLTELTIGPDADPVLTPGLELTVSRGHEVVPAPRRSAGTRR